MEELTLSEQAYHTIRRMVTRGELKPGEQIVNRTIAKQTGMSFIPVREAINKLASEGLVDYRHGSGAFVKSFGRKEVNDTYDIRDLFEPYASAQASKKISQEELAFLDELISQWYELAKSISEAVEIDHEVVGDWLGFEEDFHKTLMKASGNSLMEKMMNEINVIARCFSIQHESRDGFFGGLEARGIVDDHKSLLDVIRSGDTGKVEAMIREQLAIGRSNILRLFPE